MARDDTVWSAKFNHQMLLSSLWSTIHVIPSVGMHNERNWLEGNAR